MFLQIIYLMAMGLQGAALGTAANLMPEDTVRDHFWVWAHDAGVYNNAWGLPGTSKIMPVEGARFLDVPNVIFIRYEGKPNPPFENYFNPFTSMERVCWSITGAGGATSDLERKQVFYLAAAHPNITGLFMDDFFQFNLNDDPLTFNEVPQWLAENNAVFPVTLTVTLPKPTAATSLEIAQSAWRTGDYRSGIFVVEVFSQSEHWRKVGKGCIPNVPGASVRVEFPETQVASFRISILNTQDPDKALSCGLSRIRLYSGSEEVTLIDAKADATSTFPGHGPETVIGSQNVSAPASLSVEQLQTIRRQMADAKRPLFLGVTLYTHQLDPRIIPHLECCDVISLWTWKSDDLKNLEVNLARLKQMIPSKRIWLGCYLWDFGINQPMPIDRMQRQCELGLRWLKEGQIDGIIFLATNLCDLKIETVEWTRQWIARVGDEPL